MMEYNNHPKRLRININDKNSAKKPRLCKEHKSLNNFDKRRNYVAKKRHISFFAAY